jgi:hypothetical protein
MDDRVNNLNLFRTDFLGTVRGDIGADWLLATSTRGCITGCSELVFDCWNLRCSELMFDCWNMTELMFDCWNLGCSELVFHCWNMALEIQACLFGYLYGGME